MFTIYCVSEEDLKKGDYVYITDFPHGRPINAAGKIVAALGGDFYNVLMDVGLNEGKIIKFKYWSLIKCKKKV